MTNAREFVQGDRDREIGIDRMQYVHTAKLGLPSHAHLMAVLSKTNRNSGVSLNRCFLHSPNVVGLLGLLYLLTVIDLACRTGPSERVRETANRRCVELPIREVIRVVHVICMS